MDDMEREALRRAEQMRSAFPGNAGIHRRVQENPVEKIPVEEAKTSNADIEAEGDTFEAKNQNTAKEKGNSPRKENSLQNSGKSYQSRPKFPPFARPLHSQGQGRQPQQKEGEKDIFDFLLKDKDATLIMLLIFFLYEDNSDPMLLMALVYLLV